MSQANINIKTALNLLNRAMSLVREGKGADTRYLTRAIRALEAERAMERDERQHDEGWFVVDHNRSDAPIRGPFRHSETAAQVRKELEARFSGKHWSLWVIRRSATTNEKGSVQHDAVG